MEDAFFSTTNSDIYLMKSSNLNEGLTNALMISTKQRSQFWQAVLDEAVNRYNNKKWYWFYSTSLILNTTGPKLVTHVFNNYDLPLTLLPTIFSLCNVCSKEHCKIKDNSYIKSLKGKSWHTLSSKISNVLSCNIKIIIIIILILIILFIISYFRYMSCCKNMQFILKY
jgi:hypothetical protein